MKVILISGKARHGKDTAAAIIADLLERDGHKVLTTHYADLLKYICKTFFFWNGDKDDAGRTLLQRVGTNTIRAKQPDYWVRFIADILDFFPNEWDYVLIPDCRFPNEIDEIKNRGFETVHVRVVRDNFDSGLTKEQLAHPSETALDGVVPDICIKNNGSLDALENNIKTWIGEKLYEQERNENKSY